MIGTDAYLAQKNLPCVLIQAPSHLQLTGTEGTLKATLVPTD